MTPAQSHPGLPLAPAPSNQGTDELDRLRDEVGEALANINRRGDPAEHAEALRELRRRSDRLARATAILRSELKRLRRAPHPPP